MTEATHIHFLGIAGIGVSALAQVARARGRRVSGSDPHADPQTNPAIHRLLEAGATIYREHRSENLAPDVDLVVASAAVAEDNPEILAARRNGIRVISRADFLGELMAAHPGPKIAVAGTHGKTTTTSMLGVMLQHAGQDPTVFVGGEVRRLGGNVRVGSEQGPFIAEACEAYDSFLSLAPEIAVLTNIEADHLDHYGTMQRVYESFHRFLRNLPDGRGRIVGWADDPGVRQAVAEMDDAYPVSLYGWEAHAVSRAENLCLARSSSFDWIYENDRTPIVLHVPGRHNVLNALAAATVGRLLGLAPTAIAEGLAAFEGTERRQEILGTAAVGEGDVLVMDDYAHHPTEIRETLTALRSAYPDRRLIAVFQPHLYSRTRDFLPEFAKALATADVLIVTDIYAARETPLEGVQAADIVRQALRINSGLPAFYIPNRSDIPNMLLTFVRANDLALFLGAGDIREQGEAFFQRARAENRETSA